MNTTSPVLLEQRFIDRIKALKTDQEKNTYLQELWHEDQSMRSGEDGDIISKHGFDSEEYRAF